MVLYKRETDCCGCGVCQIICPRNAITMEPNKYGFLYPKIDQKLCIECGGCKRVCAYQNVSNYNIPQNSFAGISKREDILKKSASGGVFASIAKDFISDGGWVCGAVMDFKYGKGECYHLVSNHLKDIERMQGSKYVQSSILFAFKKIQNLLKQGEKVLFCGTPCQVDVLRRLTNDSKNLYTIDIICHGVPSLMMFNDFLNNNIFFKQQLIDFIFRDKSSKILFCARKTIQIKRKIIHITRPAYLLSYYHYFLKSTIYRENCYSCPYATKERISDLTIGDYWGIKKVFEKEVEMGIIDIRKTWSCVILNTYRGKQLLEQYGGDLILHKSSFENIAFGNAQLNHPSVKSTDRKKILELYSENGYSAVEKDFRQTMGIKYYGLLLRYYFLGR